ncbi:MAG: metallophosphoesterase [Clostridia bacterium]|nr:metallophosphoesterase [Clostridia bacterium]
MFMRLITSIALVFTLLFQNAGVLPAKHADDIALKAVLVSDIHADADPTRDRTNLMREVFAAIGRTQNDADTLVMSGDLTNSGDLREYINLENSLNLYCRIYDRVPEMGNHDSWHHSDDPDYSKAQTYFRQFCLWNGINTDKVYFTKQVNGIPFIVTGVEDCDFKNPYHSEEQLAWLEKELNAAVEDATPVFLICHKPVEDLCDSSARMAEILKNAAQKAKAPIVYVSGHQHEIGENTFSREGMLVYLNLPSMLYTDDGGLGFTAEIREHSLTLTGMNFLTSTPLEDYIYIIEY